MPPIRTNRTTCLEIPRGRLTSFSLGQSSNWVDHGRVNKSVGSGPVANCIRTRQAWHSRDGGAPGRAREIVVRKAATSGRQQPGGGQQQRNRQPPGGDLQPV